MEIDYIALFVNDVERSLIFYRDILHFRFEKPIKNGGTEGYSGRLKIGLYDRSWLGQLFDLSLDSSDTLSTKFLLSMTVEDLDRVYEDLLKASVNSQVNLIKPPTLMPWGQRLIFLRDPDDNLIEIVQS
jgi:lactoylglutathione lyase